jgi:hypothetical protein
MSTRLTQLRARTGRFAMLGPTPIIEARLNPAFGAFSTYRLQCMPINLRYDLRFRFDRTLARRLDAAWRKIDHVGEAAVKPRWWDAFHANRMRRSFIRHRVMYRIKARVHVALTHTAAILEASDGNPVAMLIFLPFWVVAWLIAPRPFPPPARGARRIRRVLAQMRDRGPTRRDPEARRQTQAQAAGLMAPRCIRMSSRDLPARGIVHRCLPQMGSEPPGLTLRQ